jgi:hypothetical protein
MSDLSLEIVAVVLACGTFGYFSTLLRRKFTFSVVRMVALVCGLSLAIGLVMWFWAINLEGLHETSVTGRLAGVFRSVTVSLVIGTCALILACQKRRGSIGIWLSKFLRCHSRTSHDERGDT